MLCRQSCTYSHRQFVHVLCLGHLPVERPQTRKISTSTPSGCTGGTPAVCQSPALLPLRSTYSGWGTCTNGNDNENNSNVDTRQVAPGMPASLCHSPAHQPAASFTYSAWGTCQSNSTQTRTVSTSSPSGCTGGTPVRVTILHLHAAFNAYAGSGDNVMHKVPRSYREHDRVKSGGYKVSGRTASAWVSAITGMGATLASGTTLQDYGNFLAALP